MAVSTVAVTQTWTEAADVNLFLTVHIVNGSAEFAHSATAPATTQSGIPILGRVEYLRSSATEKVFIRGNGLVTLNTSAA